MRRPVLTLLAFALVYAAGYYAGWVDGDTAARVMTTAPANDPPLIRTGGPK